MGLFRKSKASADPAPSPVNVPTASEQDVPAPARTTKKATFSELPSKDAEEAAAKIQAIKRGKQARVQVEENKKEQKEQSDAAAKIQAIRRGNKARGEVEAKKGSVNSSSAEAKPLKGVFRCLGDMIANCTGAPRKTISNGGPAAEVINSGVKGDELTRTFATTDDVQLKPELQAMLDKFFKAMDSDGDGSVTKEEAVKFWGKNFAKVNAQSMFNEVDEDASGSVTWDEFTAFWKNVVGSGYSQEDLIEEVEMMLEGGSWVDFNDGRTT